MWFVQKYHTADVISTTDYYPFGSPKPGRNFNSSEYRYGFNGMEKDDEVKGSGNSYDFGARMYDSRVGRWLKPDNLEYEYPSVSPYIFTLDNPILFIDPEGNEVYIFGKDAGKAVAALQTKTSLELSYNTETGMLTATGVPQSKLDKELMKAIKDKNIITNLYTTRKNVETARDGTKIDVLIGGYGGNEIVGNRIEIVEPWIKSGPLEGLPELTIMHDVVSTEQFINMRHSKKAEKAGASNQGSDVFHELIESYYAGQIDPGGLHNMIKWEKAHDMAHDADPSAPHLNSYYDRSDHSIGLYNEESGTKVQLGYRYPENTE